MAIPSDEWFRLLASWSKELLSATDRIHFLIGNRHQLTKGSYREALLRALLRRVLPDRFRVSTGFIYRWNEQPSRQIDVLIWDAQHYSALLEEGELAILTADAVAAIIEVKSILSPGTLRDALELLHPAWLVNWRHTSETSLSGLKQQTGPVPFRAIFAFSGDRADPGATASSIFSELASFYGKLFRDDAERALAHTGNNLEWINMVNAVCVADGPEIEQTHVNVDLADGGANSVPGFVAYSEHSTGDSISVGRFCMSLLWSLTGWAGGEAAQITLRAPAPVTRPGVCCFGKFPSIARRVRVWGKDVPEGTLWCPEPPLWTEKSGQSPTPENS